MKEGWEIRKLGEVGTFTRGGGFVKSDFVEDGFPCLHYGQIHTKLGIATYKHLTCISNDLANKIKKASKGDLIIAITSEDVECSCKCTAWMGDYDIAVGGHAAIFKHGLDPIFMSYYFKSPLFQKEKEQYTHGFKVVEIKPDDIAKIPIPIPPLSEQQRIVSKLDSAFEKIDALKANAENNLKNAKDLFQQVLKKELEPKEGWKYELLRDVSTVFSRGKSKHRPRNDAKLFGGAYPFIQTGEIRNSNKYVIDYTTSYNDVGLSQSKLWPSETLCITIAANIAETAILKFPCCFPDSVIGLVVDKRKADVNFMYYMLQSFKAQLQELGKGSAQDNINLSTFENKRFPIPSLSEQQRIVFILDSLSEKCKQLEENYSKTVAECDALKQSILREVMSGE